MSGTAQWATMAAKRLVDIAGSLFGTIVLSPIFLTVASLVRHKLGPPIFFARLGPEGMGSPLGFGSFER